MHGEKDAKFLVTFCDQPKNYKDFFKLLSKCLTNHFVGSLFDARKNVREMST